MPNCPCGSASALPPSMPRSPAVSPLLSCAHQYPYSFHTISRFFPPRLGAVRRGSSTSDMSRTPFASGPHIHTVLQSPRLRATSELSYRGLQDKLPCSGRRLGSPPWKNPVYSSHDRLTKSTEPSGRAVQAIMGIVSITSRMQCLYQ